MNIEHFLERFLIVVLTIGFLTLLAHEMGWWGYEPEWYRHYPMPDTIPAKAQHDSPLPVESYEALKLTEDSVSNN